MSPEDIKGAFEERLNAVNELRALVDETNGEFDGEQEQTFERLNKSIDDLDRRINNGLTALEQDKRSEDAAERFLSLGDLTAPVEDVVEVRNEQEADVIRQLISGELRTYQFGTEQRDLATTSTAAGGAVVPTSLFDRVIARLYDENSVVQAGATVINTTGGEAMTIPLVTAESSASLIAELGSISDADPTFSTATLNAYKIGMMVEISHELAMSQGVAGWSLEDYVGDQLGRGIGRKAAEYFCTGTGSSQPDGYASSSTSTGVTTAGAAAITYAEVVDLVHSVIPPYRNNDAAMLMNDSTVALLRKLVDSNGLPLWSPSTQVGTPDRLLGFRVLSDPNMAAATTGNTSIVFGDFSRFFVRYAMGLRIDSTIYNQFANDITSIRGLMSIDSVLTDTNAIKKMVQA